MCFKPPQPLTKFDLQKIFKSLLAGLTNQPYMAYSTRDNPLHLSTYKAHGSVSRVYVVVLEDYRTMKLALAVLSALSAVYACSEGRNNGHTHDYSKRAIPSSPLTPPTRPLEWGDVNILHTTDTHGWLLGHQKTSFPEPNYRLETKFITRGCGRRH